MSTYNPFTGSATGVTNGRGVPRCHLSKRLDLAACAVLGWAPLQPSIEQALRDFLVPRAALKQRIEHFRALEANGNGQAPAPVAVEETNGSAPDGPGYPADVWSIITGLLSATPEQRAKVARELGCDWVWDHLIMPCMHSNGNG
jgi:hypothetical protein